MAEQKNEFAIMLSEHSREIAALAPEYLNKNRMMSIFLEAVNSPKIRQCTKLSVLKSAKKMAELGVDVVGNGGVWLVPYGQELTVLPDWRLMIAKARTAGVITHASAEVVYDGDVFSYERGMNPNLIHKPSLKRGKPIAAYCVYTLPDGTKDFNVMTFDEIEVIRGKSKAGQGMAWKDFWGEMAKKTVIRRALKPFEGSSSEYDKVIDADNEASGMTFDFEPISEPQAIKKNKVVDVEPEPQKKPAIKETPEEPTPTEEPGNEAPTQQEEEPAQSADPFKTVCEECPKEITSRVADFSKRKYGKKLCMDCQDKREKK
jgi:recombination protein RecT